MTGIIFKDSYRKECVCLPLLTPSRAQWAYALEPRQADCRGLGYSGPCHRKAAGVMLPFCARAAAGCSAAVATGCGGEGRNGSAVFKETPHDAEAPQLKGWLGVHSRAQEDVLLDDKKGKWGQ